MTTSTITKKATVENTFKVGDIFADNFGGRARFYQAVRITARCVFVREIKAEVTAKVNEFEGTTNYRAMPVKDVFISFEITKVGVCKVMKIQAWDGKSKPSTI
jgi:hypothetical protein